MERNTLYIPINIKTRQEYFEGYGQEDYFIDPLSSELSLKAVKDKIMLCHEYGMKAMAYGAVYAASKEFYLE